MSQKRWVSSSRALIQYHRDKNIYGYIFLYHRLYHPIYHRWETGDMNGANFWTYHRLYHRLYHQKIKEIFIFFLRNSRIWIRNCFFYINPLSPFVCITVLFCITAYITVCEFFFFFSEFPEFFAQVPRYSATVACGESQTIIRKTLYFFHYLRGIWTWAFGDGKRQHNSDDSETICWNRVFGVHLNRQNGDVISYTTEYITGR